MWISGPVLSTTHNRCPPSDGKQYKAAPSVWCMPAPKTTMLSATAGELTVGCRMNGASLDQVGFNASLFGAAGRL